MSDSNPGGTQPPHEPYGNSGGEQPYSSPAEPPYGQPGQSAQPGHPGQPGPSPYGAPPPYGQQPVGQPGQPVQQPYGQPNPYGAVPPYGQQPVGGGPLGDGLDMYGRPLGNDERPGTVTAAGWITIIFSGLTALLYGFLVLAMLVAKDDVLREIDKALADQGSTGDFSAEDTFGVVLVVLVVFAAWCVIACILAVFAMRRSQVARILLIISAIVAALLSLLAITSVVSAVWLIACIAVVVLLFTGGAGDWFAHRRRY